MVKIVIKIPNWLEKITVLPVLLYRRIRYGYPFRRIPLTQGKYAIVDSDDYYHLAKYKWHAARRDGRFYAIRAVRTGNGKKRHIPMHRQVLKVAEGLLIDHINRNGLDNRRANLRPATPAQNVLNRTKFKKRTYGSKYKGVTYNRTKDLYQAQIQLNRKYIFLGFFQDEVRAAKAYDLAAKKYHGDFAALNFPDAVPRFKWRFALVLLSRFLAFTLTLFKYVTNIENRESSIEHRVSLDSAGRNT